MCSPSTESAVDTAPATEHIETVQVLWHISVKVYFLGTQGIVNEDDGSMQYSKPAGRHSLGSLSSITF